MPVQYIITASFQTSTPPTQHYFKYPWCWHTSKTTGIEVLEYGTNITCGEINTLRNEYSTAIRRTFDTSTADTCYEGILRYSQTVSNNTISEEMPKLNTETISSVSWSPFHPSIIWKSSASQSPWVNSWHKCTISTILFLM